MTDTVLNPLRSSVHQAAEQALTLSRQGGELYLAQARLVTAQVTRALDTWQEIVTAQQHAALAASQVVLDAWKPVDPTTPA